MGGVSLKLVGTWPAWNDQAQRGSMVGIDADEPARPVLVLPVGDESTLSAAQQEGRRLVALKHPQILPLLRVMLVAGRPCCVFPFHSQVSVERVRRELAAHAQSLPLRVILELAVAVADVLGTAWNDAPAGAAGPVLHPGVGPDQLLITEDGQVQVSGLRAVPRALLPPTRPGYLAPEGFQGAPSMVYAIGALLVDLLAGEPPAPASTAPERQAAMVRRSLIRVLSRPGPRVPERLVEVIQSCLTIDGSDRSSLPRLSIQLSALATEQPGPGLEEWSRTVLTPLRGKLTALAPMRDTPPVRFVPPRRRDVEPGLSPTTEGGTLSRRPSADAVTEQQTDEVTVQLRDGVSAVADTVASVSGAAGLGPATTVVTAPSATAPAAAARSPQAAAGARAAALPGTAEPATAEVVGAIAIDRGELPAGDGDLDDEDEWKPRPKVWPWVAAVAGALALAAGVAWLAGGRPALPPEEEVEAAPLAAAPEVLEVEELGEAPVAAPEGTAEVAAPAIPPDAPPEAAAVEEPVPVVASVERPVTPRREPLDEAPLEIEPRIGGTSSARVAPREEPPPDPVPVDPGPQRVVITTGGSVAVEAPPAAKPPPYTVRFRGSADAVSQMEVTCHGGKVGSGLAVTIPDAVPGPCKVTGTTPDGGRLVALVTIREDGSYQCFDGGVRACR